MGRGQVKVHDQFSKILGSRRGSALGQKNRDREEALALIEQHLAVENDEIDPLVISPIAPFLEAEDEEIAWRTADAVLANIRYNSLRPVMVTLRASPQEVPAALQRLVRKVAAEYITLDKSNPADIKRAYVFSFSEIMFTEQPLRPLAQVKADAPLIRAIGSFCEDERKRSENSDLHDAVLGYLGHDLSAQPADYLPTFAPWRKFLLRSIPKNTYSKKALKELANSLPKTPETADFFAPIWEALRMQSGRFVDIYGNYETFV